MASKNSFTLNVKKELLALQNVAACCKSAEIAAISGEAALFECPQCRRAYIRGAFLANGCVVVPRAKDGAYVGDFQLEIAAASEEFIESVADMILDELEGSDYSGDFRIIQKGNRYLLYVKRQEQICDILTLCGAPKSMLWLLEVIMERKLRADANRGANCISANLERASQAAAQQLRAIEKLQSSGRLSEMNAKLIEVAEARQANPHMSLAELAQELGITKSGLKHRLDKLMAQANSF